MTKSGLHYVAMEYYNTYVQIIMDMYDDIKTNIRCTSVASAPFFVLLGVYSAQVSSILSLTFSHLMQADDRLV